MGHGDDKMTASRFGRCRNASIRGGKTGRGGYESQNDAYGEVMELFLTELGSS